MLTELNERLDAWREAKEYERKWRRQLQQLNEELQRERQTERKWKEQLEKEQQDVEKLSGLTWTNLFHTFLGRKEERLREEKKEVVEAKLKYDESAESVRDIEQDMRELEGKLRGLGNLDREYQNIIAEKERLIRDSGSPMSEQLFEIAERKAEIRAYLKEVNEAVSAGQSVLQSLRRAESSLNSAGNWGTWDMIGGGAISTAVKHSRINDAQKHVHAAQSKMRRFRHELKDIEMHAEVHFDIGDMLKFADFFFDGLIVDWMVQGRIRSSLDQVRQRAGQISGILNQLRAEAKKMEAELNRLQRQYTSMVESA